MNRCVGKPNMEKAVFVVMFFHFEKIKAKQNAYL